MFEILFFNKNSEVKKLSYFFSSGLSDEGTDSRTMKSTNLLRL